MEVFRESTWSRSVIKTSSTTKTTTMTTPAKLYGKDLSEYEDVDVEALLGQLSADEINILAKEVDPDDQFLPPDQRHSYECTKSPTGPLDRKKLIDHINKQALETPDVPEFEPFVPGVVRGKKWVPPPPEEKYQKADEQIAIDLGDEYETALSNATQEEIIDLAAILGFHSMMNQDQYHASLLNKGQPIGLGWDGITKASRPKAFPMEPPNTTDVDETIKRVKSNDTQLIDLNWNNIKNISDEKFDQLFEAIKSNNQLQTLQLTNTGLQDKHALKLAEALDVNGTLKVLNVETNFISPPVIVRLIKSLLSTMTLEEFRASNQRSAVLGNKIEMDITDLVEKNTTLLRLGLHLEYNDCRHRVATHLQRNIDRIRVEKRKKIQELQAKLSPLNVDTLKKLNAPIMRKIGPIPGSEPQLSVLNALKEANRRKMSSRPTPTPSPEPHLLQAPNGRIEQYTPSPSPEPVEFDTEIDPDNMIVRGSSDVEEHEYDEEGRIILKNDN
ncbi:tropomodulin-1 isoform X2 [Culicoides brevitarsis]|uniref:tropomodulin-1 isoform X2 n=1 Tax=Culicoides brevitarsis TaxID=469753 RepID=UPI00307BED17